MGCPQGTQPEVPARPPAHNHPLPTSGQVFDDFGLAASGIGCDSKDTHSSQPGTHLQAYTNQVLPSSCTKPIRESFARHGQETCYKETEVELPEDSVGQINARHTAYEPARWHAAWAGDTHGKTIQVQMLVGSVERCEVHNGAGVTVLTTTKASNGAPRMLATAAWRNKYQVNYDGRLGLGFCSFLNPWHISGICSTCPPFLR